MFSIFSSPKFSSSLSSSSSSAICNNQQENQAKKSGKCSKSSSFSNLRRRVNPLRAEVPSSSSMDTISAKTTANNAVAAGSNGNGSVSANVRHHHHHEHHQESGSGRKTTAPNVLKLRPSGCSEQQLTPPSTISDNAVGIQTTSPLSNKSIERYVSDFDAFRRLEYMQVDMPTLLLWQCHPSAGPGEAQLFYAQNECNCGFCTGSAAYMYSSQSPLRVRFHESKALKMDRKTLQHYYEAFRLFDKNRDGSISTGELRIVMHSLGLYASDTDLKTLIDGFDENENGAIEFEEFVNLMLFHVNDKNEIEDLRHAFYVFDKDKDGYISSIELSSVMKSLGETMNEKEIRNLIREADKDGDGKVNFEEFQAMLKEPASRSS